MLTRARPARLRRRRGSRWPSILRRMTDRDSAIEEEKGAIATVGEQVSEVNVSIGPQFLQLFSEQLYSSPNKAFEELVTNSWDAGAISCYIGMAPDLDSPDAAVWVLDNGESTGRGRGIGFSGRSPTRRSRPAARRDRRSASSESASCPPTSSRTSSPTSAKQQMASSAL